MALWQYLFQILPRKSTVHDSLNCDIEDFDEEPFWKAFPIHRRDFSEIAHILRQNTSWSKKIDLYGEQDSSCLEVMFDPDSDTVVSASFRIDFRTDFQYVLDQVIEFSLLKGFIILDEKLQVIPMNCEIASQVIITSPQYKTYLRACLGIIKKGDRTIFAVTKR